MNITIRPAPDGLASHFRAAPTVLWSLLKTALQLSIISICLVAGQRASAQDSFETVGPYDGPIASIHVWGQQTVYVSGPQRELYCSTNGGTDWSSRRPAQRMLFRTAVDSGGNVWALCLSDMLISTDHGRNWVSRSQGLPELPISDQLGFLRASRHEGVAFVYLADRLSTSLGQPRFALYRTTSQGERWDSCASPNLDFSTVSDMTVSRAGTAFISTGTEVWKSADDGATWDRVPFTLKPAQSVSRLVADARGALWLATVSPFGLWRSTDDGGSWTPRQGSGLNELAPSIIASSGNGALYAATDAGCYRSGDSGDTFVLMKRINVAFGAPGWVAVTPGGNVLAATGDALYRSVDDVTWTEALRLPSTVWSLGQTDQGDLVAGTTFGIYHRSQAPGSSWVKDSIVWPVSTPVSRIVHERDRWYASVYLQGAFHSQGPGTVWTSFVSGIPVGSVVRQITPVPGDTVFAAGTSGLYRSLDGGSNWDHIATDVNSAGFGAVIRLNNGDFLAGSTQAGMWRSSTGGDSWARSSGHLSAVDIQSLFQAADGTVYAGSADGILWMSLDNGNDWISIFREFCHETHAWSQNAAGTLYLGGEFLLQSTDNGNSWTGGHLSALTGNIIRGVFPPVVPTILSSADGRMYVSAGDLGSGCVRMLPDSGDSWEPDPLGASRVLALAGGYTDVVLAATDSGVFIHLGVDGPWASYPGMETSVANAACSIMGHWLIGANDGLYFHQDWPRRARRHASSPPATPALSLATEYTGRHVFVGTDRGVYRVDTVLSVYRPDTFDLTWTLADTGLPGSAVNVLAISGGRTLFAGVAGNGLYQTTDHGSSWTGMQQFDAQGRDVLSLAIFGAGTVYAGTNGAGLKVSTDNGASWRAGDPQLAVDTVFSIATNADGLVFAATGRGLWRSFDRGATFARVDSGADGYDGLVRQVIVAASGRIYYSTDHQGLRHSTGHRPPLAPAGVHVRGAAPRGIIFLEVYPNPVSGVATVNWRLSHPGTVRLSLFNALGIECRVLASGQRPAGEQTVEFTTADLPSGVYYARLIADDGLVAGRLVVVR